MGNFVFVSHIRVPQNNCIRLSFHYGELKSFSPPVAYAIAHRESKGVIFGVMYPIKILSGIVDTRLWKFKFEVVH